MLITRMLFAASPFSNEALSERTARPARERGRRSNGYAAARREQRVTFIYALRHMKMRKLATILEFGVYRM